MKIFDSIKEFMTSGLGYLLATIGLVGNLYWLWLAFGFKKVWMFIAAFFPLTAFFTAPVGAWALVFGTPNWLTELATGDEYHNTDTLTESQLRSFAEEYNKQLPKRLDSKSVMVNVSVRSGPTIAYYYVWEDGPILDAFLEDPQMAQMSKASAIRAGCSDPEGAGMFLDHGVTIEFIAHQSDGTLIYDFEFDVSDCTE